MPWTIMSSEHTTWAYVAPSGLATPGGMKWTCVGVTSAIVPSRTWRASRTILRTRSTRVLVTDSVVIDHALLCIGIRIAPRFAAARGDAEAPQVQLPASAMLFTHRSGDQPAVHQPHVRAIAVRSERHLDCARPGRDVVITLPAKGEDHARVRHYFDVL